jgi:hypothetical protein
LIKKLYYFEYGKELKDYNLEWENSIMPKDESLVDSN